MCFRLTRSNTVLFHINKSSCGGPKGRHSLLKILGWVMLSSAHDDCQVTVGKVGLNLKWVGKQTQRLRLSLSHVIFALVLSRVRPKIIHITLQLTSLKMMHKICHSKQESWAIAKMTARCAQYMGALENFESPTTPTATFPEICNGLPSDPDQLRSMYVCNQRTT